MSAASSWNQGLAGSTRYFCGEEERRARLRQAIRAALDAGDTPLGGIDFLEVVDQQAIGSAAEPWRQRILQVQCFVAPPATLGLDQVRIAGGVRETARVQWLRRLDDLRPAPVIEVDGKEVDQGAIFPGILPWLGTIRQTHPSPEQVLVFGTDSRGDASTYRLELVNDVASDPTPIDGFDPRSSGVEFSFKVECESDFDCRGDDECPPQEYDEPAIDYLAKDYRSFRRLMLDRMSAIVPDWKERHPADLGVMLVELLAYVGDHLSYFQDATATEAYLGTARRRVSVRRHARLVDYFVDEGRAARAWVHFEVEPLAGGQVLPGRRRSAGGVEPGTPVVTGRPGRQTVLGDDELDAAHDAGAPIFETAWDVTVFAVLNRLTFHTWSDRGCCLPRGATRATLRNPLDQDPESLPLAVGDLLLFEEVAGPETGSPADADPSHRHVVRISRLEHGHDPVEDVDVVEIHWPAADALPFPLCVSVARDDAPDLVDVSVARGNLVLADHGITLQSEELAPVPAGDATFAPRLREGPLSHVPPLPEDWPTADPTDLDPGSVLPASLLVDPALDPELQANDRPASEPAIWLDGNARIWRPRRDLLASDPSANDFVAEIEDDGRARLRFGDDRHGKRPDAGSVLTAHYRVGNGRRGNVGADALAHVVSAVPGIRKVRNPLPAWGGRAPEGLEEVRQFAPQAFRVQQRAVTENDYARVAERHPEVQKAAASFRWTGSWTTVFVTVDRRGGEPVDAEFEAQIIEFLNRFRMAGYDLEVDGPRFVSLDLALEICVEPGYEKSAVARRVLDVLGCRPLADGGRGLFHPDAWTFGQFVYLSPIYAAVSAVDGVDSVRPLRFQRWRGATGTALGDGFLPMGRLEIPRLDNDASRPENGRLELSLGGGR